MKMSSKDELGKFWVLSCVARYAKYLNVCRIGSKAGFRAVRLDVMPLQVFLVAALLTLAALLHNLTDDFSAVVLSFACAAIPSWVVGAFWHSRLCSTGCGTVFSCSSTAFSNLKLLSASFAYPVKHCFGLLRMKFVRARTGTSVGFAPNVCVRANKLDTASSACQNAVSAPFNFSLEFRHG